MAVATSTASTVEPSGPQRVSLIWSLVPTTVAAGLAVTAVLARWRGSDLPAHFFRVGLVERDGFEVWNNYWFGGHHTLGYGILFPLSAALLGIWTVAVLSAAVAAFLVDRLLIAGTGRRQVVASLWFATGTVTNVAIGRLPFALGLAVGAAALLTACCRRWPATVALTIVTATASPVVSAFLAIIYAGWAVTTGGRERRRWLWLVVAAVAPVLVVSVLYPQGGSFPFRWLALVGTLVGCLAVVTLVRPVYRGVRATAVVYALAAIAAFVVPTPLGANITRLGMFAAAPVILALGRPWAELGRLGRVWMVGLIPLAGWWLWSPSLDAILRAGDDPSTEAAYYRPLLQFFDTVGAEQGRVEMVPTARHWEAAYVALRVPIARGWERQLDKRFNPLFYEDGLSKTELHQWLVDNGVQYVALPDVPLDDSGVVEADLIERGVRYLRPVWRDAHWRVWEVLDSDGLVEGPADVVEMGADTIELQVHEPGDLVVRVRSSAFWASDPAVCIESTDDGWIVLRDVQPGPLKLYLDEAELVPTDLLCEPS